MNEEKQKPLPTLKDRDNSKPPTTYQNRSGTVRVGNRDVVVTYKTRKEKPA